MDSEILLRLINSTEEAIIIVEKNGLIYFANERANQIVGQGESIVNKDLNNIVNKRFGLSFADKLSELENSGEPEIVFLSSHQDIVPHKFRLTRFDNDRYFISVISVDEPEHSNAYRLYKLLAENAFDLNLMFKDDELIYVSPSIQDFLGYSEKEIRTKTDWLALFHPVDLEWYNRQLKADLECRAAFSAFTYRQKHKDGSYLWFETKIKREFKPDGSVVSIITSIDVTQRLKVEKELERQKEFIEELFDTDPNLIFVRDGHGKIIYCNKAVAELVGMSREEFLALEDNTFPATKEQAHEYAEMEHRVINLGQEIIIEEKITDKNGNINHFQTLKKPLRTKDGDVNVLNISTNINKIKYYQSESLKLLKARNEFFSAMSHEIRTPMNSIMGMTDLLLKRTPREDQYKLLHALNFSSKNLLNLINDVLDFSKIEAGKIEIEEINFNLKELVDNVHLSLNPKAFSKNLSFGLLFDEKVPHIVKGDSVKLGQILNNLVGNALKFTEKGNVSVHVDLFEKNKEGCRIKFEVIDTGIGIPEDKITDIFNPFQQASRSTTRKYGGTGLGLTIVKNLVEMLKGEIKVESVEGEGSVFKVTLPFKVADSDKIEQSFSMFPPRNHRKKIDLNVLYVEDVLTNQYLLEEILKDWGVKIESASSGKEALEKVRKKAYDLILMDIQMPEMDGYEVSQRIRGLEDKYFQQVPILALTANTSKATKGKIIQAGMQDFIIKPVNIDELRTKLIQHSRFNDSFDLNNLSDQESDGLGLLSTMSYEQTDKLFNTNIVRYQEFLKKTIEEFENNYSEMTYAIRHRDEEIFRRVNHRMKSIISMMKMDDLASVIEDIKNKLQEDPQSFDDHAEIKGLQFQFDIVKDNLTNKLSSLKWH